MANFSGGATNLKFGGRSLDHTFRNACARPPCVLLGEARPAQHPASLPFSPGSQPLSCPAPVRPPVRPREGAASPRPASPRSQQRSGLLRPPCPTCGAVDGGLGALVVSHPAAGSATNSSNRTGSGADRAPSILDYTGAGRREVRAWLPGKGRSRGRGGAAGRASLRTPLTSNGWSQPWGSLAGSWSGRQVGFLSCLGLLSLLLPPQRWHYGRVSPPKTRQL